MNNLIVNGGIKANEVILIDSDGSKVGKVPIFQARQTAEDQNLDLILVDNKAVPICKIADYGKLKYEQSKKKHKSQSNKGGLKEIRFGMNISDHDLETKIKKTTELLEKGHKVKYVLLLRGNTRNFTKERTDAFFNKAIEKFKEDYAITTPVFSGNQITSTISCK